ncbi:hypothetical protein [Amycolatopsis sp. DSM 110486]|uniref:hypothetical protein n=1 Tax=Amycolatopsis sp. DSM 110486 TaxID=2865832 RepID=UPI001C6A6EDF|nr:hypothetical protein [Amycolatopsis sp. DSM 110486]QYN23124.1 hypothetical protein K1T34_12095 [Amycolatopsis sp. DSM 110486]
MVDVSNRRYCRGEVRIHSPATTHARRPGSHDAFFHNQTDAGSIQFGSDKQTLIGITIGCHLIAATKNLGHIPPTPT